MKYGITYMGSKSTICEKVCRLFPKADHFYDLFGGGFSITHFMIKHRKSHYKEFHFNELRKGIPKLIQDAIAGKYNYNNYKPEWISRERFFANKENDPMTKIIWSFGNNGKDYLFGKEIEQYKKSMHMAIIFNEFDNYAKEIFGVDKFAEGLSINDKRLYLRNRIKFLRKDRLDLQQLEQLGRIQQLEQLEQLGRIQQLQQLGLFEKLFFHNTSYENIPIKENSIIYCDIPYTGTAEYDKSSTSFNRINFFDWAWSQKNPVFISEYNVEDARFKCISNFKKRSLMSSNKNIGNKLEKIYVNDAGYRSLFRR